MLNTKTDEKPQVGQEKTTENFNSRSRSPLIGVWVGTKHFLRILWVTAGLVRRLLIVALLALSLLFNGLLVFNEAVQLAVSAVANAVNLPTVVSQQADEIARISDLLTTERDTSRKAKTKLTELEKKSDVTKKLVEDTTERVNRRFKFAATREIAVMSAEVIPYLGATAIVTATVWGLYDMCQTMKDMSELTKALDTEQPPAKEIAAVCGMEVPDGKELLSKALEAPKETWEVARKTLDGLGKGEDEANRLPEISEIPQPFLGWLKETWKVKKNILLWWQDSE